MGATVNSVICNTFFLRRLHQAVFHFFPDHMLAKGRNEMFGPARDDNPVRIDGNKSYRIPNIISPEPRIVAHDQRIVLSDLDIFQTISAWGSR